MQSDFDSKQVNWAFVLDKIMQAGPLEPTQIGGGGEGRGSSMEFKTT